HLRNRQSGVHIPSGSIQQHQQPLYALIVLNLSQLGQNMVVFGSFTAPGKVLMSFHLSNNGNQMDSSASLVPVQRQLSVFFQMSVLFFLNRRLLPLPFRIQFIPFLAVFSLTHSAFSSFLVIRETFSHPS